RSLIQDEEERVVPAHGLIVIAAVGLGVGDLLARVLDESRPLGNVLKREGANALDRRASQLEPFIDRAKLGTVGSGRGRRPTAGLSASSAGGARAGRFRAASRRHCWVREGQTETVVLQGACFRFTD